MVALLKFLFFCALAVASGVAAVSVPVMGKTPAEHVRAFVLERAGQAEPSKPAKKVAKAAPVIDGDRPAKVAVAKKVPPAPPPSDGPTEDERAALEDLLGKKLKR